MAFILKNGLNVDSLRRFTTTPKDMAPVNDEMAFASDCPPYRW
jgi:hypothetical protein